MSNVGQPGKFSKWLTWFLSGDKLRRDELKDYQLSSPISSVNTLKTNVQVLDLIVLVSRMVNLALFPRVINRTLRLFSLSLSAFFFSLLFSLLLSFLLSLQRVRSLQNCSSVKPDPNHSSSSNQHSPFKNSGASWSLETVLRDSNAEILWSHYLLVYLDLDHFCLLNSIILPVCHSHYQLFNCKLLFSCALL